MKQLLATFLFCLCSFAFAQPRMPATTRADVAALQTLAARQPNAAKLNDATRDRFPVALIHGRCMVGFLGRANNEVPTSDERVSIGARIGDIVSFRVDVRHLDLVHELPWLSYVELATIVRPALDRAVHATRADSVHQGINLPHSFTGHNVIIGIVDWGIQYNHPMFYDTALTHTRILAAWDMSKQSGPAPAGFTAGTVYDSPAELMAAVRDTLGSDGYRTTHGTHVAGIAGGGGAGTAYKGIAYEADILMVSPNEDNSAVMDALSWLQQRALAEQKRLVVNMSFGNVQEGGDCHSLFVEALDLLADQGVMLVAGAGNFGGEHFHLQKSFNNDTVRTRMGIYLNEPGTVGQRVVLWGEAGQPFSATLTIRNTSNGVLAQLPWVSTAGVVPFSDSAFVFGNDTVRVELITEEAHPSNGRPYIRLQVHCTSAAQRVDLSVTAASGTVHAWNVLWYARGTGWYDTVFQPGMVGYTHGDDAYGILQPSCANGVLSVAAYLSEYQVGSNWAGGTLATFSSKGPTLDGTLKPEITAPGLYVISSIDLVDDLGAFAMATITFQGDTFGFGQMSGTSMAGPMVTGIAALLLEAMPFATPAQIKQAIMDNARTDQYTGVIPPQGSTTWGMGKVNAYATVVDMLGIASVGENGLYDVRAWPNPFSEELMVLASVTAAPVRYSVLDVTGRTVASGTMSNRTARIGTASWSSGMYLLRVEGAVRSFALRVVKP